LTWLAKHGATTARELQKFCNLKNSVATKTCLDGLVKMGHIEVFKEGRATVYSVLPDESASGNFVTHDVPF